MLYNIFEANAIIGDNSLDDNSFIRFNTLAAGSSVDHNALSAGADFGFNALGADTRITQNNLNTSAVVSRNIFKVASFPLANKTLAGIAFEQNIIGINISQTETYNTNIENKRGESGFSNFETSLIVDAFGAITFTGSAYTGIINIKGGSPLKTITGLNLLSTFQYFRIKPVSGLTLTINSLGNFKFLGGASSITLNGSNNDYCEFWTDGAFAYQNTPANNF